MKQRGRKSASALAVIPDLSGRLPLLIPPATLTAAELATWRTTVDGTPRGWFQREQVPLLVEYCAHVAEAARLRQAARADDLDLATFATLSGLALRESALALAFARSLRLTTQSRMASSSAARRADGSRSVEIDWEAHFEKERQP